MTWSECLVEAVRLLRLGELTSITSGFPFKSEFFGASGTIPVVRNRDVARGYSTTFYSGHYTQEFVVNDGDLLVSMDGDFRAERWKGGMAVLNQRVCRISPDPSLLDPDFLRFFLPRRLQLIQDATPFATVKHLSVKTIAEIKVPLHPLAEQRRIVAVLDKADGIRQKRRESLGLLDQFLGSAFLEMFGDPVRNEKGWEAVTLDLVAQIVSGVTKGRKLRGDSIRQVPYLRVANVQDGYLDLSEVKVIDASAHEISLYELHRGDILLTEGGDADKLGRGAVWHGELDGCIHQNHIFRVRLTGGAFLPEYVSALLGSAYGKRYFLKAAKQTTGIASINRTQLSAFPLLRAPVKLQQRYSAVLASSRQLRDRLESVAETTEAMFESLAQQVFQRES